MELSVRNRLSQLGHFDTTSITIANIQLGKMAVTLQQEYTVRNHKGAQFYSYIWKFDKKASHSLPVTANIPLMLFYMFNFLSRESHVITKNAVS